MLQLHTTPLRPPPYLDSWRAPGARAARLPRDRNCGWSDAPSTLTPDRSPSVCASLGQVEARSKERASFRAYFHALPSHRTTRTLPALVIRMALVPVEFVMKTAKTSPGFASG